MTVSKALVAILAVCFAFSLVSCSYFSYIPDGPGTATTEHTEPAPTDAPKEEPGLSVDGYTAGQVLDYFAEVAFGSEYGESDAMLCRWEKPINVKITGATDSDRELIARLFERLNGIEGFPGIKEASLLEKENFTVDFVPKDTLMSEFENADEGTVGMSEFTWLTDTHEIVSARAAIFDGEEYERESTVCEEILQSLGIGCDSYEYPDSMFYEGRCYYKFPSELDFGVIALLYSPALHTGMSLSDAMAAAAEIIDWNK